MLRVISVETGLDDIKAHLSTCGYEVIDMADCVRPVEAVIFSGEVPAVAPVRRPAGSTVIINAAGMNGAQVETALTDSLG